MRLAPSHTDLERRKRTAFARRGFEATAVHTERLFGGHLCIERWLRLRIEA